MKLFSRSQQNSYDTFLEETKFNPIEQVRGLVLLGVGTFDKLGTDTISPLLAFVFLKGTLNPGLFRFLMSLFDEVQGDQFGISVSTLCLFMTIEAEVQEGLMVAAMEDSSEQFTFSRIDLNNTHHIMIGESTDGNIYRFLYFWPNGLVIGTGVIPKNKNAQKIALKDLKKIVSPLKELSHPQEDSLIPLDLPVLSVNGPMNGGVLGFRMSVKEKMFVEAIIPLNKHSFKRFKRDIEPKLDFVRNNHNFLAKSAEIPNSFLALFRLVLSNSTLTAKGTTVYLDVSVDTDEFSQVLKTVAIGLKNQDNDIDCPKGSELKIENVEDETIFWCETNRMSNGPYIKIYEGGQVALLGEYAHDKQRGKWIGWYKNGQKEFEGSMSEGRKQGKWARWYESGQKQSEDFWKDGKQMGQFTVWHEEGTIKLKGKWKEGVQVGSWIFGQKTGEETTIECPEDSQLKGGIPPEFDELWCEKSGKKNGPFIGFYANGNKSVVGTYLNGLPHGAGTCWDRDAKEIRCVQPEEFLINVLKYQTEALKENLNEPGVAISAIESYCHKNYDDIKVAQRKVLELEENMLIHERKKYGVEMIKKHQKILDNYEQALTKFVEINSDEMENLAEAMKDCE